MVFGLFSSLFKDLLLFFLWFFGFDGWNWHFLDDGGTFLESVLH